MPKFLLVTATKFEVQPLAEHFKIDVHGEEGVFMSDVTPDITLLITGVGMVNTAYYLGRHSHNLFDFAINVGVCGAFDYTLDIGQVVNVVEDTISELGAEDGDNFIKYADMNLPGKNVFQNQILFDNAHLNSIKKVKGITVNKVHGNTESIKKISGLFSPDVESMEGAAFLRACSHLSENYFQLRAVSNYVEKRDRSKWNMPLAINNLNEFVVKLITDLNA